MIILSALVGIGTWLYLKYDELAAKSRKYKTVEYGEKLKKYNIKDLWGIEDIRDGVIKLKGNRFSAVLEIEPINYMFMSEDEQEAVENALIQTALSFNMPVQFYTTTQNVETENIIDAINRVISNTDSMKLKSYGSDIVEHLAMLMADRNVYAKRSYIVLSYDGLEDKAYDELNKAVENLAANLKRVKIVVRRLDSGTITDLLHSSLNRGSIAKPSEQVKEGAFELYVTGGGKPEKAQKGK